MLKVGLTGGIGSGKSIVSELFKVLGIPVFDADREAKKIMGSDEKLIETLKNEFGAETYKDGSLNRSFLAKQVFNDRYKLEKLNALVHPVTIAAADKWMNKQTSPYVVKEAALLFEARSAVHLDLIVGVFAPMHIRLQRIIERDQLTVDEITARMSRQIDDEIKMKLCDFVIMNDEQKLLTPQVLALHEKLIEFSSSKK